MASKVTGMVVGALMAGVAAQAAPADHYAPADLVKAADTLKAQAASTGSASMALAQYPNHHTMLAYRTKNGGGELHEREADLFVVVRGKATLLTEGTLEGAHQEGTGEVRGTAVIGGKATPLKEGDIVHIPANTPHQLLIASGDELLYFVVKITEK